MTDAAQLTFQSTGIAELDQAITDFLAEPMGDWTTDELPISALADGELAHGMCQMVSEQAQEFFRARGFTAYACNTDMDEMGYRTTGKPHGEVLDARGNIVMSFYFEHTVLEVYVDKTETNPYGRSICIDFTASQYGYSEMPKITL
jgi:hypothetical protein